MLFLHFQIGDDAFALAAERIVEILPLLALSRDRNAPAGVAGSFDYRGRFVPVVDLCELELGRPAARRMSTRIVLVNLAGDDGTLVGLIAEKATETLRLDPGDFAPFASGPHGLVQRADVEALLPDRLQQALRGASAEA